MSDLIPRLVAFRNARDWARFHTPANLAEAVNVEAGELQELFLWGEEPTRERVAEETADVLIYCLYMCEAYGLEPEAIIREKMTMNAGKYPV